MRSDRDNTSLPARTVETLEPPLLVDKGDKPLHKEHAGRARLVLQPGDPSLPDSHPVVGDEGDHLGNRVVRRSESLDEVLRRRVREVAVGQLKCRLLLRHDTSSSQERRCLGEIARSLFAENVDNGINILCKERTNERRRVRLCRARVRLVIFIRQKGAQLIFERLFYGIVGVILILLIIISGKIAAVLTLDLLLELRQSLHATHTRILAFDPRLIFEPFEAVAPRDVAVFDRSAMEVVRAIDLTRRILLAQGVDIRPLPLDALLHFRGRDEHVGIDPHDAVLVHEPLPKSDLEWA